MSLQNLLLGLGTALVAVAAVVFTAVNWDRMTASAQGLLLVALTAVVAGVTVGCSRRRMPATAEALGLVTLLLALVDAHAARVGFAPEAQLQSYWAGALASVAVGAWAFGRAAAIRSTRIVAAGMGQVPLLLLIDRLDVPATPAAAIALAQAGIVLGLALTARRALRPARELAAVVALLTWGAASLGAVVTLAVGGSSGRLLPAGVVGLAAAIAAMVAVLRPDDDAVRAPALMAASGLALGAAVGALSVVAHGEILAPAALAVAVAVIAVGLRSPARWGRIPAGWATGLAVLAVTPLAGAVLEAVGQAVATSNEPFDGSSSTAVRPLLDPFHTGWAPGPLAALLGLTVLLVLAAGPVLGRRGRALGLLATAVAAVVAAPLLAPLTIGGTVAASLGGVAALTALAAFLGLSPAVAARDDHASRRDAVSAVAISAAVLATLAGLWATATPELSLLAVGVVAGLAAGWTLLGRRIEHVLLAASALLLTVWGAAAEAGLVASARGASGSTAMVVASLAALAVGLVVAALADPTGHRTDLDGLLASLAEGGAWAVHGIAVLSVLAADDRQGLSLALAAGALVAGVHAARPGRRPVAVLAVAEALVAGWLQLGLAGVTAIEAYTLPVALIAGGAGWWSARRAAADGEELPSWSTFGPGLVLALAPTVLVGLGDPGLVRPLAGLVAGAVVLCVGALHGRRAPVDVGIAVVTILGLKQLAPVVGGLPNWATVGATGLLLLAVGATFEQRRRDLHDVKHRYASLR